MNRQPHDTDAMAELRAMLRGPNNAPMKTRAPVDHRDVMLATTLVDRSGLAADIAAWRAESTTASWAMVTPLAGLVSMARCS